MADDNIAWHCRQEAQAQIDAGIGDGWPLTQAAATIEAQRAEIERLTNQLQGAWAIANLLATRLENISSGNAAALQEYDRSLLRSILEARHG